MQALGYLPLEFYNFILEKYKEKTLLKNVEGKEAEYSLSKNMFNSLYGMSVTNDIRDEVLFEENEWSSRELDNYEIVLKLIENKEKGFLNFAWGVYITSYARRNLLLNVSKLDKYVIYCDTDSIKLLQGFDIDIINKYNDNVKKKLEKISKERKIDFKEYEPKDNNNKKHLIGLFEKDGVYSEFITQGAKKYAYRDNKGELHITISGVPKKGVKELNNDINNFRDNLIFHNSNTGKNIIQYNDNQPIFEVTDDFGNCEKIHQKYGVCILPTTYILGKSSEYSRFISSESSKRAIYMEEKKND